MEPLVTLHWVDVSQCFPTDDLQWCRCSIQVPPCGHEARFVAPMRLRLALAMLQGEARPPLADPALDVLSTLASRYGVLYTCLLHMPVFRDGPAVVYSVYRKEETPFANKDGLALLDRLVTELLAYEDAMAHLAADVRARRRTTRVEQVLRQFGRQCRQELTRALFEAFGLYGPKDHNFYGLPAFSAIAKLLRPLGLLHSASQEAAAGTVKKVLQRSGVRRPRRTSRAPGRPRTR